MKTDTTHRYSRGDYNPAKTHRFWGYQKVIVKKTGRQGERWIPAHRYESYRERVMLGQKVCSAAAEYRMMQRSKLQLA